MHGLYFAIFTVVLVIKVSAEGGVSEGTSCTCKDAWSYSKLSCTLRSADDIVDVKDAYCKYPINELRIQLLKTTEITSSVLRRLRLSRLKIVGEYIENVSEAAFMEYKGSLDSLEISQSILKNVPASAIKELNSLRSLLLTESNIRSVNCSLRHTSLENLMLRDNEISSVDPCSFPRNLSMLSLKNNHIEELNGSLKGLGYLRDAYISRNRITTLEGELEGLNSLRILDASYNKIQRIGTDPLDLPKLGFLNVSRNRISELGRSLGGLSNLYILDLSYNDISALKAKSFSGLSNLVMLYLSDNRIRYLEDSLFQNLKRLETLVISHNVITTLQSKMTGLYSLKKLDASWNNIRYVDNALSGITELEEINLSYNRIKRISNLLSPLSRLKVLNLAWNEIEEISEGTFEGLDSLETLNLSGNSPIWFKGTMFTPLTKLKNLDITLSRLSNLNDLLVPGFMNISVQNESSTAAVPAANEASCSRKSTKRLSIGTIFCYLPKFVPDSAMILLRENGIELVGCREQLV